MFGQLPEWCVLVDGVVVVEVLVDGVVVVDVLVDGVVVELPLAALAIAAPPPIAAPARDRATRATRIGCRMGWSPPSSIAFRPVKRCRLGSLCERAKKHLRTPARVVLG
jgi:hypothetical protein